MAGKKKARTKHEPSLFDNDKTPPQRRSTGSGKGKSKKSSARRKTSRGPITRTARFVLYWGAIAAVWCVVAVAGIVIYYGAQMPSASTWAIPDRPPNVKIVAVDGSLIANRGVTGGEAVPLSDMSPYIPEAIVAIEDKRFYSHFAIDPIGLGRALVTNLISGHTVQGGSTLTQQLAKNLFLSPDRTLERKVQEVLLAVWLETKFTKDQILELYLNRVYFGSGAYGVEAASQRYFHKSASDVTLGEAALLAGLVKAPSRLSPAHDPKAAEDRAQVVLTAMHDQGMIDDEDMTAAMARKPTKAPSYWSGAQHYAADMVMSDLPDLIGDVKGDIIVHTTIDPHLEKAGEEAIQNTLDSKGQKYRVSQGALVAVDATGAVRAVVGGRDYAKSQYNRAATAKRQPGSAFKPFVYASALEIGDWPDSVRNDAPIKIGDWTPENYEKTYEGPITLTEALAHSVNTIAAQLVMEAGPDHVVKLAHRLGIESDIAPNASIALGTSEVTLMELTSAYTAFMNGGYKATPYLVSSIETSSGKSLYKADFGAPPRVLAPQVAANMDGMLMHVVTEGTGRRAAIDGWQVAGKTGTTQSSRDALFIGFTSNLTAGIWLGNDDNSPMKGVTGGTLPAETWHNFMAAAHKGLTPKPLYGGGRLIEPSSAPAVAGNGGTTTITDFLGRLSGNGQQSAPPTGSASQNNQAMPVPPGDVGTQQPQPARRSGGWLQLLGGG
ncbi:penicillin-binding protein [Martelella alba]|uniref:Penicillin-binding protein n=1 Tax=Martelella alba TaxID=2590451 RepID=A0A506UG45_9HYPH|nr:transglycosylase domain-containing protein [Martelella alba]TPW32351.1 penicillin-binding protein [Martelella alba]